ncbi:MAG TPA: hypothetical protein VEV82_02970 [Actinomycetota bacterium]|nr:hypothetical protein [Actinomycetota bacterium]
MGMANFARKHATTIVVSMMTALVTASVAPAIAHGNVHAATAHNSDKVDGFHAVKSKSSKTKRRGKLVATSPTTGLLPNNIIKKAPDANKLDGFDSLDFLKTTDPIDADTLDGVDSTGYALASHVHDASDITTGTLDDTQVGNSITVDAGGIANDGTGSGLDADLLDGKTAADFVNQAGTGIILVQGDVSNWKHTVGAGTLTSSPGFAQTTFTSTSFVGNANMFLVPDLPLAAYGKRLRMVGVEFCYDASVTHIIDLITYHRTSNPSGTPTPSNQVLDVNDHSDEACRFYSLTDPGLFSDSTVGVSIDSAWTDDVAVLRLGRVTFMLEPTATDATPLS